MVRKCRVPGCNNESSAGLFQLPKDDKTLVLLCKQLGVSLEVGKHSAFRACSRHFTPESLITNGPSMKLKPFPIVISNSAPKVEEIKLEQNMSQISLVTENSKIVPAELDDSEMEIIQELSAQSDDKINGLGDFTLRFEEKLNPLMKDEGWRSVYMLKSDDSSDGYWALFKLVPELPLGVKITATINIHKFMRLTVTRENVVIRNDSNSERLKSWSELETIIKSFSYDNENEQNDESIIAKCVDMLSDIKRDDVQGANGRLSIIVDMLKNEIHKKPSYSIDTLVMAQMIQNLGPRAYEGLKNFIKLPHVRYLQKLSKKLDTMDNDKHFARVYAQMKPIERILILQVDEIYLRTSAEYKNGQLTGLAQGIDEGTGELAKTGQFILASSLFGSFKEMVSWKFVKKNDAQNLKKQILDAQIYLEKSGFIVQTVAYDGNKLNTRLSMALTDPKEVPGGELFISYPSPTNPQMTTFVVNDFVHIIKCMRNNLMNAQNMTFMWPNSEKYLEDGELEWEKMSFGDLRQHAKNKSLILVNTAHKLTRETLYPTNFDKQKVRLVDNILNAHTIASMREDNFIETANGLSDWSRFWNINNVRTLFKGQRRIDRDCDPISRYSYRTDKRLEYLQKFLEMIDAIHENEKTIGHRFTEETYHALRFQIIVTLKQINYIFDNFVDVDYILLGKFSTDDLENRFGMYRRSHGTTHHVSSMRLLEAEKKIRVRHTLSWGLKDKKRCLPNTPVPIYDDLEIDELFGTYEDEEISAEDETVYALSEVTLSDAYLTNLEWSDPNSIEYIAGYCANQVSKRLYRGNDCQSCKSWFTRAKGEFSQTSNFFNHLQRGGLKTPTEFGHNIMRKGMALLITFVEDYPYKEYFLRDGINQANILITMLHIILQKEGFDYSEVCGELILGANGDHTFCDRTLGDLIGMFCKPLANVLLSQYAKHQTSKAQEAAALSRIVNRNKVEERKRKKDEIAHSQVTNSQSQATTSGNQSAKKSKPSADLSQGIPNISGTCATLKIFGQKSKNVQKTLKKVAFNALK